MKNEEVENTDCFCALSNSDADNIVSSVFSKQLGAKQVITLVNRDAYLSLIISGYIAIDIAVSPQQITSSAILKYFRKGNVTQSYSLRRGVAEVLEIKVEKRRNEKRRHNRGRAAYAQRFANYRHYSQPKTFFPGER